MHKGNILKFRLKTFLLVLPVLTIYSCNTKPSGETELSANYPSLLPDYAGITIPVNIAPLNFIVNEKGLRFFAEIDGGENNTITIRSKSGHISIPPKKWKNLLQNNKSGLLRITVFTQSENDKWTQFKSFTDTIAAEPVDRYLTYRLLYPGYEQWNELSINQRDLESYHERPIIENEVADDNCVNCHSYNNGNTGDFLFHIRGNLGGTYFYSEGDLTKANLKTEEMKNGAVYPRWHPSGRYIAFSSNKIVQQFHAADNKKVEVMDLESSLVIYDKEKNEMIPVSFPELERFMDTYPEWSPDGKYLYFCRAEQIGQDFDYQDIEYNLFRAEFDPEKGNCGNPEMIFNASEKSKSISFPRISPDGKFLVMTMQDYGCFPIWHEETDLYLLDLKSSSVSRLSLNSDSTDSYHSWSSNGRWLVFSSKRGDGLTARPYLAYINEKGEASKPFILPQRDPAFYDSFLKTYNIPEFSSTRVRFSPGKIRKKARSEPLQAEWADK